MLPSTTGSSDSAALDAGLRAPLLMSLLAGLATGLGGLIAVPLGRPGPRRMSFVLAFAAGVMSTVSVLDLWLPAVLVAIAATPSQASSGSRGLGTDAAVTSLSLRVHVWALAWTTAAIAAGAALFVAVSRLIPTHMDPPQVLSGVLSSLTLSRPHGNAADTHCSRSKSAGQQRGLQLRVAASPDSASGLWRDTTNGTSHAPATATDVAADLEGAGVPVPGADGPHGHTTHTTRADPRAAKQWRLAILMLATLTLHNLPEGVAVAMSSFKSLRVGGVMAASIALHNIPEGLAIAVPVMAATNSGWLAVVLAFASGLTEPLGAALALFVLRPLLHLRDSSQLDPALCVVAGVMLAVVAYELLPQARRIGTPRDVATGFVSGAAVIAATLYTLASDSQP